MQNNKTKLCSKCGLNERNPIPQNVEGLCPDCFLEGVNGDWDHYFNPRAEDAPHNQAQAHEKSK